MQHSPFFSRLLPSLAVFFCAAMLGGNAPAASPTPAAKEVPLTTEKTAESAVEKTKLLDILEDDHVLGDPDAPVLIIEYASLSCPHCAHFHKDTFPELKKRYIDTGKAAFVFRHFPFNDPALRGALLTECVGEDKFFTFLKVLFNAQEKWAFSGDTVENLRTIANVGGVGNKEFDECMANKAAENRLVAGVSWASKDLGVSSTPTLFINGEKIEAARDINFYAQKIDGYLSK